MDVTPSKRMFDAMNAVTDASVGEEPSRLEVGSGAEARRVKRRVMMDALHSLVAVAMREGVKRAIVEARARRDYVPDAEDRAAMAQAVDDAQGQRRIVRINGS